MLSTSCGPTGNEVTVPQFHCRFEADRSLTEKIMTRVKDLLGDRGEIFFLREDATVHEAARYLRECQVRATPVCDEQGRPVGVIAQSDISDKIAAEHLCPSWVKVREIMSTHLITVTPESNVEECVRLME